LVTFLYPWLRHYYFLFLQTNVRHDGIQLPVSTLRLRHHRHVIRLVLFMVLFKFHLNRTICDRVMAPYPFSRWRPRHRNYTSGSNFHRESIISMLFCICLPSFVQIRPSVVELWHHSGRQPYWVSQG